MPDFYDQFTGWLPTSDAEMDRIAKEFFVPFAIRGAVERKRTTAWEVLEAVGQTDQFWRFYQETGDCVSFGSVKAKMAVEAYEIVRLGQPEKYRPLFPPYDYAVSRCAPEGGNNRLRNRGAGSMGAWIASTIRYGVLRADHPDCPKYSGALADQWGNDRGDWRRFIDIADDNQFKVMARIENADQLADAICSGYFCTIAGNRQYPQTLTIRNGKGWYSGGRRYPHQTSYLAFDTDPEPCFYDSNQWPGHAGNQPDGPDGGGWRSWDYVDRELRSGAVECFAASQFDGFPSDEQKPDFSMGA